MSPQAEKKARQQWLEERGAILRLTNVSEQAKLITKILNRAIRGNLGAIATVRLDPSNFGVSRNATTAQLAQASDVAKALYTIIDMAIDGELSAITTIKFRHDLSYLI